MHIGPSRFDRDRVLSEYQTINPPDRPIKSLSEAEQEEVFDDLARRIEQLIDSSTRRVPPVTGAGTASPLPPKPPRCIGREQEVETLVGALLAGEPTPVLGPAGIGKSTVCLQALHDRRIAERFDGRRYFVRLDGAHTAKDMLAGVGAVLGIPADQTSIGAVVGHLAGQPAALALDNLETPWEAETLETEALLAELAAVPGLSLTVTLRSRNRPGGVAWREAVEVVPLSSEDAKRVFLAIAGDKHAADAHLGDLLAALDGVPLAIELMAHAAESEPDLAGVWQRWQTERTEMLKRGAEREPPAQPRGLARAVDQGPAHDRPGASPAVAARAAARRHRARPISKRSCPALATPRRRPCAKSRSRSTRRDACARSRRSASTWPPTIRPDA